MNAMPPPTMKLALAGENPAPARTATTPPSRKIIATIRKMAATTIATTAVMAIVIFSPISI